MLDDGVTIAERMGLKGEHISTVFLCNFQRPYKILDLEPAALIDVAQSLELLIILKIIQHSLISFVSFYCDNCNFYSLPRCRLYQKVKLL